MKPSLTPNSVESLIMKNMLNSCHFAVALVALLAGASAQAAIRFETFSAYHQIQVIDEGDLRTLSFNGSWETCMNISDPHKGHFSYTEFFQMPMLWKTNCANVLMIGLGGGSTPRAYQYYHPSIRVDMIEIDPEVVKVAKKWFNLVETNGLSVHVQDGRMYLDRNTRKFDSIIMDAYQTGRYGSEPPAHLVTREFFALVKTNLTDDGVLAYNLIGTESGSGSRLVGNVYKTLQGVFPRITWLKASDSQNIVIFAFKSAAAVPASVLRANYAALEKAGHRFPSSIYSDIGKLATNAPAATATGQVLLDSFSPPSQLRQ